jgi:hypothetical protein
MNKPAASLVAQYVVKDGLKELVLLPVWWYTTGLGLVLAWTGRSFKGSVKFFDLDVWVKNLFVPMYGEEGFTGRAISFGVRLFMIIIRSVGVAVLILIVLALLALYVLGLPVLCIGIVGHGVGLLL